MFLVQELPGRRGAMEMSVNTTLLYLQGAITSSGMLCSPHRTLLIPTAGRPLLPTMFISESLSRDLHNALHGLITFGCRQSMLPSANG